MEMKPERQNKNPHVKEEEIAKYLERTGFVFEMRVNEVLVESGYRTLISSEFLDLDGSVEREIDIIATKRINNIEVHLIIECKQSATDKWIFLGNKKLMKSSLTIKHLPVIAPRRVQKAKIFEKLYSSTSAPLCHNYLAYTIAGDKEGNQSHITDCIHKLPKALVDFAARGVPHFWRGLEDRYLFFPVALFSNQMFVVWYKGTLQVKEVPALDYFTRFDSIAYAHSSDSPAPEFSIYPEFIKHPSPANDIRAMKKDMRVIYEIKFVTENGLPQFLKRIEMGVETIDTTQWPVPAQSTDAETTQPQ